jgi:hypothetical protein
MACGTGTQTGAHTDHLQKEIDSLTAAVRQLSSALKQSKGDSSSPAAPPLPEPSRMDESWPVVTPKPPTQPSSPRTPDKPKPLPKKEEPSVTQSSARSTDTIKYWYTMQPKRVSVLVTPWKDGRRSWYFYDPFGNITFEQEDVNLSYHIYSDIIRFHDNGAVDQFHIHLNPGASMYMYDTQMTFSINNQPEWKTENKHPSTLEEMTNNQYYWDKKTKTWKKQEVQPGLHPVRE